MQQRFGLVQAEQLLAVQRLHRLHLPRWLQVVPIQRSMKPMPMDQSQCHSWSGPRPRQLVVPVDPELLQSLAELARHRFALVLTVQQLAGPRQLLMLGLVQVEPELLPSLAVPLLDRFGPVQAVQ